MEKSTPLRRHEKIKTLTYNQKVWEIYQAWYPFNMVKEIKRPWHIMPTRATQKTVCSEHGDD